MRYCKKCVMPDTRPGIYFDGTGVCSACRIAEKKKKTNWEKRYEEFEKVCEKYRGKKRENYDCIITVSGGKDSHYQVYIMTKLMKMNPLLIAVVDPFSKTQAGLHNLKNIQEAFSCDLVTYHINPVLTRKMARIAFEAFGMPNWPIDLAIYSVPLRLAIKMNIPFIIYGENISYEYGGPHSKETPSAKDQIKNNVVKPIDWEFWFKQGIHPEEVCFLSYPSEKDVELLNPVYLSYYFLWDGYEHMKIARKNGFKTLGDTGEWKREGFIEDFDQIDSIGYLVHPWLKYPKFGHARATDVASYWIRGGRIDREEGIRLVKEHDHKLDTKALEDFLDFTGYSKNEFWNIVDTFFNRKIFKKVKDQWKIKKPIYAED